MRPWRVCAALLLLVSGCAGDVEPRWAETAPIERDAPVGSAPAQSPRLTETFMPTVDVGTLRFQGRIEGRAVTSALAPSAGRILDTLVSDGQHVAAGDAIVVFAPLASRAEELEREILELERTLGVETQDDALVAASEAALAALDEAARAEARTIEAELAGVVTGVRAGLSRAVDVDEELFQVVAADELFVAVSVGEESARGLRPGVLVDVVPDARRAGGSGTIESLTVEDGRAEMTVVVEGLSELGGLGDVVDIVIAPELDEADVWVSLDAVHRGAGDSFLLVERPDGSIERVDAVLGRRTERFVEVVAQPSGPVLVAGVELVLP